MTRQPTGDRSDGHGAACLPSRAWSCADCLSPGTCDLSTTGRRSGTVRRIEIWYLVIDGQVVVTGTPGPRSWLANLRSHPDAILHLRSPARDLAVLAREVTDQGRRRHVAEEAGRLQPWYADQPYSIDDWVDGSPMVVLEPADAH